MVSVFNGLDFWLNINFQIFSLLPASLSSKLKMVEMKISSYRLCTGHQETPENINMFHKFQTTAMHFQVYSKERNFKKKSNPSNQNWSTHSSVEDFFSFPRCQDTADIGIQITQERTTLHYTEVSTPGISPVSGTHPLLIGAFSAVFWALTAECEVY